MEITDLSDILSEPIFGELSDHILDDIDIHEFDSFKPFDEQYMNEGENTEQKLKEEHGQNIYPLSRSTSDAHRACHTLEALLRSVNPPSRVPPAPELHSDTTLVLKKEQSAIFNGHFRDSSPIIAHSAPFGCVNNAIKNPYTHQGKSKLIFQHLENSPSHCNSWVDTNESEKMQPCVATDKHKTPNDLSTFAKLCEENQKVFADDDSASGVSTVKKAPHNAIEKRYRASINGRIDELRNILLPYRSFNEKLNKSAVLRKAIECIRDLEKTNQSLKAELASLQLAVKGDRNVEHTISKETVLPDLGTAIPLLSRHAETSCDSGISSLERSPCTRSLTCQSNLSSSSSSSGGGGGGGGSDSTSFTSSPGLERHCWSQQGQAQPAGGHDPTDGFTRLDTPTKTDTASLRWLISSSGLQGEQSPAAQLPDVFEMDQPLVFNTAASASASASSPSVFNLLDDCDTPGAFDHPHWPTLDLGMEFSSGVGNMPPALPGGQSGRYLQTIEHSAEHIWNTETSDNALPGSVGFSELHVKRNGDNWMTAGETGPTPRKLRRQLITSRPDGQDQRTPSSHVSNSNDSGRPDAPDCPGLDKRKATSGSTCPTVRQLLMASSSVMTTPQPLPPLRYVMSNSVVSADRSSSESASRFNTGLAARTTLCVAALCLIVLDPAVFFGKRITPTPKPVNGLTVYRHYNLLPPPPPPSSSSSSSSTTGKGDATSAWSSPARRLLLAGDGPLDPVSGSPTSSPWCSLGLGLAQWTIAICLCLWACIRSHTPWQKTLRPVPVPDSDAGTGPWQEGGGEEEEAEANRRRAGLLQHWSDADAALRESSWTIASQNLNYCLMELGDPLPKPSNTSKSSARSGSTGDGFRFRVLVDLMDSVCLRLPRWLYHFYGRSASAGSVTRHDLGCVQPISSPVPIQEVNDDDNDDGDGGSSDEQHPVELSPSAVRNRHMELCLLASYSGASFSLSASSSWQLVFAQLRSLLSESTELLSVGARCSPEFPRPDGHCSHQSQQMAQSTAVVGRTVTLALFLRDFLGQRLLSRLVLRMAIRLANCLPASSVWHRCLANPTLLALLRTGSVVRRTPRLPVICGCVTSSRGGLLLSYLLPDLRTALSQTCCHAIFFGSDAAVCDLEENIALLTSLCRFATGSTCGDRPCRNSDTGQWWLWWWSSLVPRLWCYRRLKVHNGGGHKWLQRAAAAATTAGHGDGSTPSRTCPVVPVPPPPLLLLQQHHLQPQPAAAREAATADVFACPGGSQLAQALWLAYRCLLESPDDVGILSLAERACNLLIGDLGLSESIVQADGGGDGRTSSLALDAVVSHYEAVGHVIGGANPVVVRLSLLHNRRSHSRREEEVQQALALPVPHPALSHCPISLSSSGGDHQQMPAGDVVATSAEKLQLQQHSRLKHGVGSSSCCRVVQSPGQ